jgi:hypothetical protein
VQAPARRHGVQLEAEDDVVAELNRLEAAVVVGAPALRRAVPELVDAAGIVEGEQSLLPVVVRASQLIAKVQRPLCVLVSLVLQQRAAAALPATVSSWA